MINIDNKAAESACFEVTEHGRLISGNKRFCRMFGFASEDEIQWHYVTDLFRHIKEWEDFRNCNSASQHHFIVRMRNRKGRSFKCNIVREIVADAEGRLIFRNMVRRLGEQDVVPVVNEVAQQNSSVLFIAKCAHCGEQIRVNSIAETRMRMLCGACTAKAYPEAYHLQAAQV